MPQPGWIVNTRQVKVLVLIANGELRRINVSQVIKEINMTIKIEELTRFPIKGLSGETLESVMLHAGSGFPSDRMFGFARPNSGFDPASPQPLPKTKFYMLAKDASLALLRTRYDDGGVLTMSSQGADHQFNISEATGRDAACQYLKRFLNLPDEEAPQLFEASPHRFTDVSVVSAEMMNAVSLINIDSVQAFSESVGQTVDPRRFRGNIMTSGMGPFSELDMIGKTLVAGDVQLRVVKRTQRCPATEVNLSTGHRDLKTPQLLKEYYGHRDMGVYCEVLTDGQLAVGDSFKVI